MNKNLERATYVNHFGAEPALEFSPEMLMLICFLPGVPLYPPNTRILMHGLALESLTQALQFLLPLAVAIMALCALLFSLKQPEWPGFSRPVMTVCAAGHAAGWVAMLVLHLVPSVPTIIVDIICALWALCLLPLSIRWTHLFLGNFRNVVFYGALACMASSILTWLFSLMPVTYALVAEIMLAAANFAFLLLFHPASTAESPEEVQAATHPSILTALAKLLSVIWLPLVGTMLCIFMMSFYEFSMNDTRVASECISGIFATGVLLLACCLPARNVALATTLEYLAVPLCICVCLVLGSFPEGTLPFFLGAFTVYTPLILISVQALAVAVAAAKAGEFPLPFIVSAVLAFSGATILVGYGCAYAITFTSLSEGTTSWIVMCCYFALVMGKVGYTAWRYSQAPLPAATPAPNLAEHEAFEHTWEECMATIAETHGLSPRETELLTYMAQGYGSSYIAKKLFISSSTVRTHIVRIYKKLGINSREQLLNLTNQALHS